MKKNIYIAAGGTGGHINAALSLGRDFESQFEVQYISGTRYLDYQLFKDKKVIHIDSKPLRVKNPFVLILNILKNIIVFTELLFIFLKNKPQFLIGAGGYVCGPTLLAGKILGRKIFIIEQNATLGLTNKILSKISNRIFVHFEQTDGLEKSEKVVLSGNPIRQGIKHSMQVLSDNVINILVYGGSLGARQLNQAVELLHDENVKYNILHQVGKNNITIKSRTKNYEQVEYIEDMQKAYDWANIIIARAGASTVAELRIVGKPCILIPFPGHADNHQVHNATELKRSSDFPVIVIDNKKVKNDLKEEILRTIRSIDLNKEYAVSDISLNPFKIIDEEIKKCME
jgi:UDP-N-acetylglucosamine--N-acetylmuramyl-(pentapeptide) pyrophosphoryl-undecaprenol N-acetylglucosamine transferase